MIQYHLILRYITTQKNMFLWIFFLTLYLFFVRFIIPPFVDYDSYFHWKYSSLTRCSELYEFDCLPYTIYKNGFIDHHWLFHELISVFTVFGDYAGPKIASTFLISLYVFSFFITIKRFSNFPLFWTIISTLFISLFFFRLLMIRINPLSISCFLYGILFIKNRWFLRLFILSFIYTLFYFGSVLLLFVSMVYIFTVHQNDKVGNLKIIIMPILGILFGYILHPNFPENLQFIINYIFSRVDISNITLSMNNEWRIFEPGEFLIWFSPLVIILSLSFWDFKRLNKIKDEFAFMTILCFLLLLTTLKYSRALEYFFPVSIIQTSIFLDAQINLRRVNINTLQKLKYYLLIICCINQYFVVHLLNKEEFSGNRFLSPSLEWIKSNVGSGDVILNIPYSTFPRLYFIRHDLKYIDGLEPDFLRQQSPKLFSTINEAITKSNFGLEYIKEKVVGLKYIYISIYPNYNFDKLLTNIINDKDFEICYYDKYTRIFKYKKDECL